MKIDLQYFGYETSSLLWRNHLNGLTQFDVLQESTAPFPTNLSPKLRLGKRVEKFALHQLSQQKNISIIAENIQIQSNKITLGEIDAIIKHNNDVVHLEIAFKFYLYDPLVGETELDHWIGPNRKDSLVEKIKKLKEKQFPVLLKPETKLLLQKLNIEKKTIYQKVLFKGQLFVPFDSTKTKYESINNNCIGGYYLNIKQLQQFEASEFFIPTKIDWLIEPNNDVEWLNFKNATSVISAELIKCYAPLCWIKSVKGEIQKYFIVWW